MHWRFVCMCVCVWVSDLGITDSGELPCGCWESNLGSAEEQSVVLTPAPGALFPCVCRVTVGLKVALAGGRARRQTSASVSSAPGQTHLLSVLEKDA